MAQARSAADKNYRALYDGNWDEMTARTKPTPQALSELRELDDEFGPVWDWEVVDVSSGSYGGTIKAVVEVERSRYTTTEAMTWSSGQLSRVEVLDKSKKDTWY